MNLNAFFVVECSDSPDLDCNDGSQKFFDVRIKIFHFKNWTPMQLIKIVRLKKLQNKSFIFDDCTLILVWMKESSTLTIQN